MREINKLAREGDPEADKQMKIEIRKEAQEMLSKNGHEWCLDFSKELGEAAMEDYENAMKQYFNEAHKGLENN